MSLKHIERSSAIAYRDQRMAPMEYQDQAVYKAVMEGQSFDNWMQFIGNWITTRGLLAQAGVEFLLVQPQGITSLGGIQATAKLDFAVGLSGRVFTVDTKFTNSASADNKYVGQMYLQAKALAERTGRPLDQIEVYTANVDRERGRELVNEAKRQVDALIISQMANGLSQEEAEKAVIHDMDRIYVDVFRRIITHPLQSALHSATATSTKIIKTEGSPTTLVRYGTDKRAEEEATRGLLEVHNIHSATIEITNLPISVLTASQNVAAMSEHEFKARDEWYTKLWEYSKQIALKKKSGIPYDISAIKNDLQRSLSKPGGGFYSVIPDNTRPALSGRQAQINPSPKEYGILSGGGWVEIGASGVFVQGDQIRFTLNQTDSFGNRIVTAAGTFRRGPGGEIVVNNHVVHGGESELTRINQSLAKPFGQGGFTGDRRAQESLRQSLSGRYLPDSDTTAAYEAKIGTSTDWTKRDFRGRTLQEPIQETYARVRRAGANPTLFRNNSPVGADINAWVSASPGFFVEGEGRQAQAYVSGRETKIVKDLQKMARENRLSVSVKDTIASIFAEASRQTNDPKIFFDIVKLAAGRIPGMEYFSKVSYDPEMTINDLVDMYIDDRRIEDIDEQNEIRESKKKTAGGYYALENLIVLDPKYAAGKYGKSLMGHELGHAIDAALLYFSKDHDKYKKIQSGLDKIVSPHRDSINAELEKYGYDTDQTRGEIFAELVSYFTGKKVEDWEVYKRIGHIVKNTTILNEFRSLLDEVVSSPRSREFTSPIRMAGANRPEQMSRFQTFSANILEYSLVDPYVASRMDATDKYHHREHISNDIDFLATDAPHFDPKTNRITIGTRHGKAVTIPANNWNDITDLQLKWVNVRGERFLDISGTGHVSAVRQTIKDWGADKALWVPGSLYGLERQGTEVISPMGANDRQKAYMFLSSYYSQHGGGEAMRGDLRTLLMSDTPEGEDARMRMGLGDRDAVAKMLDAEMAKTGSGGEFIWGGSKVIDSAMYFLTQARSREYMTTKPLTMKMTRDSYQRALLTRGTYTPGGEGVVPVDPEILKNPNLGERFDVTVYARGLDYALGHMLAQPYSRGTGQMSLEELIDVARNPGGYNDAYMKAVTEQVLPGLLWQGARSRKNSEQMLKAYLASTGRVTPEELHMESIDFEDFQRNIVDYITGKGGTVRRNVFDAMTSPDFLLGAKDAEGKRHGGMSGKFIRIGNQYLAPVDALKNLAKFETGSAPVDSHEPLYGQDTAQNIQLNRLLTSFAKLLQETPGETEFFKQFEHVKNISAELATSKTGIKKAFSTRAGFESMYVMDPNLPGNLMLVSEQDRIALFGTSDPREIEKAIASGKSPVALGLRRPDSGSAMTGAMPFKIGRPEDYGYDANYGGLIVSQLVADIFQGDSDGDRMIAWAASIMKTGRKITGNDTALFKASSEKELLARLGRGFSDILGEKIKFDSIEQYQKFALHLYEAHKQSNAPYGAAITEVGKAMYSERQQPGKDYLGSYESWESHKATSSLEQIAMESEGIGKAEMGYSYNIFRRDLSVIAQQLGLDKDKNYQHLLSRLKYYSYQQAVDKQTFSKGLRNLVGIANRYTLGVETVTDSLSPTFGANPVSDKLAFFSGGGKAPQPLAVEIIRSMLTSHEFRGGGSNASWVKDVARSLSSNEEIQRNIIDAIASDKDIAPIYQEWVKRSAAGDEGARNGRIHMETAFQAAIEKAATRISRNIFAYSFGNEDVNLMESGGPVSTLLYSLIAERANRSTVASGGRGVSAAQLARLLQMAPRFGRSAVRMGQRAKAYQHLAGGESGENVSADMANMPGGMLPPELRNESELYEIIRQHDEGVAGEALTHVRSHAEPTQMNESESILDIVNDREAGVIEELKRKGFDMGQLWRDLASSKVTAGSVASGLSSIGNVAENKTTFRTRRVDDWNDIFSKSFSELDPKNLKQIGFEFVRIMGAALGSINDSDVKAIYSGSAGSDIATRFTSIVSAITSRSIPAAPSSAAPQDMGSAPGAMPLPSVQSQGEVTYIAKYKDGKLDLVRALPPKDRTMLMGTMGTPERLAEILRGGLVEQNKISTSIAKDERDVIGQDADGKTVSAPRYTPQYADAIRKARGGQVAELEKLMPELNKNGMGELAQALMAEGMANQSGNVTKRFGSEFLNMIGFSPETLGRTNIGRSIVSGALTPKGAAMISNIVGGKGQNTIMSLIDSLRDSGDTDMANQIADRFFGGTTRARNERPSRPTGMDAGSSSWVASIENMTGQGITPRQQDLSEALWMFGSGSLDERAVDYLATVGGVKNIGSLKKRVKTIAAAHASDANVDDIVRAEAESAAAESNIGSVGKVKTLLESFGKLNINIDRLNKRSEDYANTLSKLGGPDAEKAWMRMDKRERAAAHGVVRDSRMLAAATDSGEDTAAIGELQANGVRLTQDTIKQLAQAVTGARGETLDTVMGPPGDPSLLQRLGGAAGKLTSGFELFALNRMWNIPTQASRDVYMPAYEKVISSAESARKTAFGGVTPEGDMRKMMTFNAEIEQGNAIGGEAWYRAFSPTFAKSTGGLQSAVAVGGTILGAGLVAGKLGGLISPQVGIIAGGLAATGTAAVAGLNSASEAGKPTTANKMQELLRAYNNDSLAHISPDDIDKIIAGIDRGDQTYIDMARGISSPGIRSLSTGAQWAIQSKQALRGRSIGQLAPEWQAEVMRKLPGEARKDPMYEMFTEADLSKYFSTLVRYDTGFGGGDVSQTLQQAGRGNFPRTDIMKAIETMPVEDKTQAIEIASQMARALGKNPLDILSSAQSLAGTGTDLMRKLNSVEQWSSQRRFGLTDKQMTNLGVLTGQNLTMFDLFSRGDASATSLAAMAEMAQAMPSELERQIGKPVSWAAPGASGPSTAWGGPQMAALKAQGVNLENVIMANPLTGRQIGQDFGGAMMMRNHGNDASVAQWRKYAPKMNLSGMTGSFELTGSSNQYALTSQGMEMAGYELGLSNLAFNLGGVDPMTGQKLVGQTQKRMDLGYSFTTGRAGPMGTGEGANFTIGGPVTIKIGNQAKIVTDTVTGEAIQGRGQWQLEDWQRALNRTQQQIGFGFQQRGLDIQNEAFYKQMGLAKSQFAWQTNWERQGMEIQKEKINKEYTWGQEDLAFQGNKSSLHYAWNLVDIDEQLRYATGRDRRLLLRQRERSTIDYSMDMGQLGRQESRLDQRHKWDEQELSRQQALFNKRIEWQHAEWNLSAEIHEKQMALSRDQLAVARDVAQEEYRLQDTATALNRKYWTQNNDLEVAAINHQVTLTKQQNELQAAQIAFGKLVEEQINTATRLMSGFNTALKDTEAIMSSMGATSATTTPFRQEWAGGR